MTIQIVCLIGRIENRNIDHPRRLSTPTLTQCLPSPRSHCLTRSEWRKPRSLRINICVFVRLRTNTSMRTLKSWLLAPSNPGCSHPQILVARNQDRVYELMLQFSMDGAAKHGNVAELRSLVERGAPLHILHFLDIVRSGQEAAIYYAFEQLAKTSTPEAMLEAYTVFWKGQEAPERICSGSSEPNSCFAYCSLVETLFVEYQQKILKAEEEAKAKAAAEKAKSQYWQILFGNFKILLIPVDLMDAERQAQLDATITRIKAIGDSSSVNINSTNPRILTYTLENGQFVYPQGVEIVKTVAC